MPDPLSAASTLGAAPHADGVISRLACARARRAGVAVQPLLKKANLTVEQIDDPSVRLAVRDQVRFINLVADAVQDDLLGFHVAQECDLRELGLLYYVLASSQTVMEALRRVARYGAIANEGVFQQYTVGRQIGIGLQYVGISRHLDRHQTECWMVLIVRVLRHLTGRRISPRRVRFVHARRRSPEEFASYLGGDIRFAAPADDISFDAAIGDASIASADPYLNKLLVGYYEDTITRRRAVRGSTRLTVENAIVPLLPHGEVRIGEIARGLGLSQRTLARRLTVEGLTFSALLAELRLDLAKRYLAEGDMSISHIAWLLGYQEVSAFSKAFKRWTGEAPRHARGVAPGQRRRTSTGKKKAPERCSGAF